MKGRGWLRETITKGRQHIVETYSLEQNDRRSENSGGESFTRVWKDRCCW